MGAWEPGGWRRTGVSLRAGVRKGLAPGPAEGLAWLGLGLLLVGLVSVLARAEAPPRQAGAAPVVSGHRLEKRWVYLQTNFQAAGNVARVESILDRAAAAGYNGVVFADVKFGRLDDGSLIEAYYANLQRVLAHAVGLGLTVIPATADFGYSESILWHDPNLAEGLPVRGERYRAEGGRLVLEPGPGLVNGDFEQLPDAGEVVPGWSWQDGPGTASFVDRQVRQAGRASLRFERLGTTSAPSGNGRIMQRLALGPWQQLHARVFVRTEGFRGGEVRLLVLGQDPSRTLQWNPIPVTPDMDWTRFDVTFNTLGHESVNVYLGVWGGREGRIWFDEASIEPAGPVNLVRRAGAPLRLTSADGTRVFEEGRDLERIEDPGSGRSPWPGSFDLWHAPPEIRLLPGSRIGEGERLRLDYYHTALVYGSQVTASLTEPAVFEVVGGQLASLKRELEAAGAFSGWMLGYDEIRVHGWDEAPRAGGGSPGEDLAFSLRTVADRARELAPGAALYTWSDMFDPYHNAAARAEPYYLVDGDWAGSWAGLDPGIGILNWHHFGADRRAAAAFFAERGQRQILAGYYDRAPGAFVDRAWLAELEGLPGIEGVMYTQWGRGYDDLEAWAAHVWGGATWVAPEATPERTPEATAAMTPGVTETARATPRAWYLPSLAKPGR